MTSCTWSTLLASVFLSRLFASTWVPSPSYISTMEWQGVWGFCVPSWGPSRRKSNWWTCWAQITYTSQMNFRVIQTIPRARSNIVPRHLPSSRIAFSCWGQKKRLIHSSSHRQTEVASKPNMKALIALKATASCTRSWKVSWWILRIRKSARIGPLWKIRRKIQPYSSCKGTSQCLMTSPVTCAPQLQEEARGLQHTKTSWKTHKAPPLASSPSRASSWQTDLSMQWQSNWISTMTCSRTCTRQSASLR